MRFIENFVLETPYLFLKKIPYAWIGAVAFWAWPPIAAGIFVGIIILGWIMMFYQQRFWEAKIIREFQKGGQPYRDHPHAPRGFQLRNVALVLAGSAVLGLLFNGRLGLSGWQWFALCAGLMFLYKDNLLFGANAVYLITPRGIAARYVPGHIDYRLFFRYTEINYVTRIRAGDKLPKRCDVLSPLRGQKEGVLLVAKRMDGFSREIGHILLTPTDAEEFLKQIPATLIQNDALIR
jgi:hypothetical protein